MSGLRDITTKSVFRVLTIAYLLYSVFPDGCTMLLPMPSVPGLNPHAYDPVIVEVLLTLAAAVILMFSFRVGVVLTYISQAIQSFGIMSPLLRYTISVGPSVWISLRLSLANWHITPWFSARNNVFVAFGFSHVADIPNVAIAVNLVPIAVIAVLWYVAKHHQRRPATADVQPSSTARS